jgi:hypothetical protein
MPDISRLVSHVGLERIKKDEDRMMAEQKDAISRGLKDIRSLEPVVQRLIEVAGELSKYNDSEAISEMTKICLAIGKGGVKFDSSMSLSQQFASYIFNYLKTREIGGTSLIECFAVFNRFLGSNWVTPKELLEAVDIISKDSKALIRIEKVGHDRLVTSKESSYESVIASVKKIIKEKNFITPIQIASQYKIPIVVARMYLSRGERRGILAIDDSLGGLRFYVNRFMSFKLMVV